MFRWNTEIHLTLNLLLIPLLSINLHNQKKTHSSTHVTTGEESATHPSLHSFLADYHPARQHTGTITYSHITTGHTRYCNYITLRLHSHIFAFGYYDPIHFTVILFWTYHTCYTNFDLDHSCFDAWHGCFFPPPNLGAFAYFFTSRLHGGNHPDDGSIFPCRKPILLNDIIMHLLHSCPRCDLNHSCSILHKSRDTFTWSSFSVGRAMEVSIPNRTEAHYQSARRQLPWRWQQKI